MLAIHKFVTPLALFSLLLSPTLTQAQDSGLALSISPLKNELRLNPGDSYKGKVSITNPSLEQVVVYPLVRDFIPSEDPSQSAPKFLESTTSADQITVANWVSFTQSSLTLRSLETKDLTYTITVPTNAEAGGHYGAIFVTNQGSLPGESGAVSIAARIGSLLLITVSGDVRPAGTISQFKTDRTLYDQEKLSLTTAFKNTGNIHFSPKGTITVTNNLTKKTTSLVFNPEEAKVLPGSERSFTNTLERNGYGRYTITAELEGLVPEGGTIPLKASTVIWVLPIRAGAITLGILLLLFILFRLWLIMHDRKIAHRATSSGHSKTSSSKKK